MIMSNRYFEDVNPNHPTTADMEIERVVDVRDEKWAHPVLREGWYIPEFGASGILYKGVRTKTWTEMTRFRRFADGLPERRTRYVP
jgi:hypothetical protein